jgi:predicted O-methyltransferase YrrM
MQPHSAPTALAKVVGTGTPWLRWILWSFTIALVAVLGAAAWQSRRQHDQLDQLMAAAFQSPLPEVEIAAASAPPGGRDYRGDYHFTQDWFSGAIPVWESVLAPYKGRPSVQYLEVGLYEGRSAVWMLENVLTHPTSHLTGIDVFQGPLKDRCLENLRRSGAGGRVTTIVEPSQVVLRRLPLETFEIIYIDGSHATSDVLEDAVLSYRLLKPGGVLIFDDYRWSGALYHGPETHDAPSDFPKAAIDRFVQCFQLQLEVVYNSRNGNQLIVRKRSPHPKRTVDAPIDAERGLKEPRKNKLSIFSLVGQPPSTVIVCASRGRLSHIQGHAFAELINLFFRGALR